MTIANTCYTFLHISVTDTCYTNLLQMSVTQTSHKCLWHSIITVKETVMTLNSDRCSNKKRMNNTFILQIRNSTANYWLVPLSRFFTISSTLSCLSLINCSWGQKQRGSNKLAQLSCNCAQVYIYIYTHIYITCDLFQLKHCRIAGCLCFRMSFVRRCELLRANWKMLKQFEYNWCLGSNSWTGLWTKLKMVKAFRYKFGKASLVF